MVFKSNRPRLSKGAIAGVVVACVCILLAAGVATLLGLRWRRRRTSQHGGGMDDGTTSSWRTHVDPFNMHRRTEERSKAIVGPVEDHGVPPATLQRPHLGKRSARETVGHSHLTYLPHSPNRHRVRRLFFSLRLHSEKDCRVFTPPVPRSRRLLHRPYLNFLHSHPIASIEHRNLYQYKLPQRPYGMGGYQ